MRRLVLSILVPFFLLTASEASSARIFPGYAGARWGTDIHTISKTYRQGKLGRIGRQVIYRQEDPDKNISKRTFGFVDNGLNAVSITFNDSYVNKIGAENLLSQFIRNFGEGTMDKVSAPHIVTYYWEDATTRITFASSTGRPEMTVLMFQQKK